ncbi:hypothetical protein ACFL10_00095 [Patescibacteria group bacterium]
MDLSKEQSSSKTIKINNLRDLCTTDGLAVPRETMPQELQELANEKVQSVLVVEDQQGGSIEYNPRFLSITSRDLEAEEVTGIRGSLIRAVQKVENEVDSQTMLLDEILPEDNDLLAYLVDKLSTPEKEIQIGTETDAICNYIRFYSTSDDRFIVTAESSSPEYVDYLHIVEVDIKNGTPKINPTTQGEDARPLTQADPLMKNILVLAEMLIKRKQTEA